MGDIQAGRLRHQVTIQQPVLGAADGIGGHAKTLTTLGTVWAMVEPGPAMEREVAGGLRPRESITVTIRYPSFTVDDTCRVLWNGQTWFVQGVKTPYMITKLLVLSCLAGE